MNDPCEHNVKQIRIHDLELLWGRLIVLIVEFHQDILNVGESIHISSPISAILSANNKREQRKNEMRLGMMGNFLPFWTGTSSYFLAPKTIFNQCFLNVSNYQQIALDLPLDSFEIPFQSLEATSVTL